MASLLLALPLALYGTFAILYRGDGGDSGETYVMFFGNKIDADIAGSAALILALALFAMGLSIVRRRR